MVRTPTRDKATAVPSVTTRMPVERPHTCGLVVRTHSGPGADELSALAVYLLENQALRGRYDACSFQPLSIDTCVWAVILVGAWALTACQF